MNRGFLLLKQSNYLIITTHLESAPCNQHIRKLQCDEIIDLLLEYKSNYISDSKADVNILVLGDMNFTNQEETFSSARIQFIELQSNTSDLYTYDSKYNIEAIKPFRINLDRVFLHSSDTTISTQLEILKEITMSDHFPILVMLE